MDMNMLSFSQDYVLQLLNWCSRGYKLNFLNVYPDRTISISNNVEWVSLNILMLLGILLGNRMHF